MIVSLFIFFCADCFPEKAVQVLAEAGEHSREVLHHGKSCPLAHEQPTCPRVVTYGLARPQGR